MFLPNPESIKSRILLQFRKKPVLSAAEIHAALGRKCSLQAVYQELRSLGREGIVRKIKKSYALDASWVLQLQAFANRLAATAFSEAAGAPISSAKRQIWKFSSLPDMDDFWSHVILYLVRHARRKIMLDWSPYAWFHLLHADREEMFLKSLRMAGSRKYTILGSSCFLNLWATKFFQPQQVVHSLAPGPFRAQMDTHLVIIDEHVITVRLAPQTARRMQDVYENTRSFEELPLAEVMQLFTREGHCTFILEHNPAKAQRLRRKFEIYFGRTFD